MMVLLGTLFCLAVGGVPTQDAEPEVVRQLKRAFHEEDLAARQAAVQAATGFDSPRIAAALVAVFGTLREEVEELEGRVESARQSSRRQSGWLRQQLQPLRELQDSVLLQLRSMEEPATLEFLFADVVPRTAIPAAVRHAALRAVLDRPDDSVDHAQVLLGLHASLEREALAIEGERARAIEKEDRRPIVFQRRRLDPLRAMQERVRDALLAMQDPEAIRWMFQDLVGHESVAVSLRMALIRRLADSGVLRPEDFVSALQSARKPGELVIVLNAIAALGTRAADAGDRSLVLLTHADATVREAAAWALAALALPRSIEPLLARLSRETGRTQRRIAAALEVLTRMKLGVSVDAWQRWFEEQGSSYVSGAVPLGGGETSLGPDTKGGYYHGIPQEGHSIVYVIDVSGSMRESMKGGDRYNRGRRARPGERTRLQACKDELIQALGALPEDATFNIVYYSDVAKLYGKGLMNASPKRVQTAQEWVRTLEADGATNIYDGLERAFTLAGRGLKDRYYDSRVETVFLLTDGKPQLPNGQWDDTGRIRAAVKRWNPYGKVVVHAIGLGEGVNTQFLKALAAENGGQFVEL